MSKPHPRRHDILEDYANGIPIANIAIRYNTRPPTVCRIARAYGMPKRRESHKTEAVDMLMSGIERRAVAKATGLSLNTIDHYAQALGIPAPSRK